MQQYIMINSIKGFAKIYSYTTEMVAQQKQCQQEKKNRTRKEEQNLSKA